VQTETVFHLNAKYGVVYGVRAYAFLGRRVVAGGGGQSAWLLWMQADETTISTS
jgi:hypothetical protein